MDKPDWLFRQACAIPWRLDAAGRVRVLLVTTRKGYWTLPKGVIDPGEDVCSTVLKECVEEAGVLGWPEVESLGRFRYRKWGGLCRAEMALVRVMHLLDHWPEASFRKRRWFTIRAAVKRIYRPEIAVALDSVRGQLETLARSSLRSEGIAALSKAS